MEPQNHRTRHRLTPGTRVRTFPSGAVPGARPGSVRLRKFAFALFGLAAALALAASGIHLTSLRGVDAAAVDLATARQFVNVQALVQAAGGVLVLGLIVLFGRREPEHPVARPSGGSQTRRGPMLLIAAGVVLMGLLPWLASLFFRLFLHLIASAPPSDLEDLPDILAMIDAVFWPTVMSATLPGLALITIGIVKLQRPRAVPALAPRRPSDPSDLGTGGPWAMILAAIGIAGGTPLFLRWQLAQMREVVPDEGALAAFQGMFRFASGIAFVFAVVLFLFGVGLLRRVLLDRKSR